MLLPLLLWLHLLSLVAPAGAVVVASACAVASAVAIAFVAASTSVVNGALFLLPLLLLLRLLLLLPRILLLPPLLLSINSQEVKTVVNAVAIEARDPPTLTKTLSGQIPKLHPGPGAPINTHSVCM